MTVGFFVATNRCYGCKTCTVSCASERQLRPGVLLRRVRRVEAAEAAGHAFVSMSCNHCDHPACVENCPVRAYEKREDGLVVQDHAKCIGCQTCVEVCPFHAPCYDEADSTTYKCDGCASRRDRGLPPKCSSACPSSNIALDDFDVLCESGGDAVSVKDCAETAPNLVVSLDEDLPVEIFADIDGFEGTIDRGGARF